MERIDTAVLTCGRYSLDSRPRYSDIGLWPPSGANLSLTPSLHQNLFSTSLFQSLQLRQHIFDLPAYFTGPWHATERLK
eukprot:scaffold468205_cov48-Prasinocladus_malaysianus.AAC.1